MAKYDAGEGYIYARCVGLSFDGNTWRGWRNVHTTRGCPADAQWIVIDSLLDGAGMLGEQERVFKRTERTDDEFLIFEERPHHEFYSANSGTWGPKLDPALIYRPSRDTGE